MTKIEKAAQDATAMVAAIAASWSAHAAASAKAELAAAKAEIATARTELAAARAEIATLRKILGWYTEYTEETALAASDEAKKSVGIIDFKALDAIKVKTRKK